MLRLGLQLTLAAGATFTRLTVGVWADPAVAQAVGIVALIGVILGVGLHPQNRVRHQAPNADKAYASGDRRRRSRVAKGLEESTARAYPARRELDIALLLQPEDLPAIGTARRASQ